MINDLPLCEICGRNCARIFVMRRKNGVSVKKMVCSSCASGAAEEIAPGATEPRQLIQHYLSDNLRNSDSSYTCSLCGTKMADIIATGKPGCCLCYSRFADELKLVIESVQPGQHHVGKTPPR